MEKLDPNKIGVYKIIFPGGEFYFGSGTSKKGIIHRWKQHRKGQGRSPKYLQETAKKYGGWDNKEIVFIILINTETKEESLLLEAEYIKEHWPLENKNPLLLNKNRNVIRPPDMSGENHPMFGKVSAMFGKHHTEEVKRKLSELHKDKPKSEEHKKKLSDSLRGKYKGEESPNFGKRLSKKTKEKIRNKAIGRKHTQKAKDKISSWSKNRRHSEETKEKMSKTAKGKIVSEDTKKLMSDNHADFSGENCGMAKLTWEKVRQIREKYSTGNYTQRQLAKDYMVEKTTIGNIIKNKTWKI